MFLNAAIGRAQHWLARSRVVARMAIKVRNQCDAIIGARLGGPIEIGRNGELWLIHRVGAEVTQFVDVGANIGAWSLALTNQSTSEPRGILYEPSPETARALRETLLARGVKNLYVVEAAVGACAGQAAFYVEPDCGETASLHESHAAPGARRIMVPVVSLDQDLAARGVDHVDFLKIDAEGGDYEVLLGCSNLLRHQRISLIQFEYNAPWRFGGATLWRACQLLRGFGYEVRVLTSHGLARLDESVVGEYYRYTNFVSYCPGRLAQILDRDVGPAVV